MLLKAGTTPHLIPLQGDQSPSLNSTVYTLDDNNVLSEEVLQYIMHGYIATQDLNIDIPMCRFDLHGDSPRGGVSPRNGIPGGSTPGAPISPLQRCNSV